MKQLCKILGISIFLWLPLYGMSVAEKRKALEDQIRNLMESAQKVVGPIVERIQSEIAQLQNQLTKLPAPQKPTSAPPVSAPVPPKPVVERPLPPLPAEPIAERPLPPVPSAPEEQAITERPLPLLPFPEPAILVRPAPLPERKPATVVTPAQPIRAQAPQMPVSDLRPPVKPGRPISAPQVRPEGTVVPEFEPLPAPSEEELIPPPVPAMEVQTKVIPERSTLLEEIQKGKPLRPVTTVERVSVQPTQPTLLEEIQRGRQLRPTTPAERREYKSDVYKLFEGEQAARGFERSRQQALARAQAQTAKEEDWQGWE